MDGVEGEEGCGEVGVVGDEAVSGDMNTGADGAMTREGGNVKCCLRVARRWG